MSQTRVLRALDCGGVLTREQIRRAAGLEWLAVRRAIANLSARGLLACRSYDSRWSITALGRAALDVRRGAHDTSGTLTTGDNDIDSVPTTTDDSATHRSRAARRSRNA